ncbi:hypothetical protein GCM10027053_11810 [Intrasporangium mesophilum]
MTPSLAGVVTHRFDGEATTLLGFHQWPSVQGSQFGLGSRLAPQPWFVPAALPSTLRVAYGPCAVTGDVVLGMSRIDLKDNM